MRRLLALSLVLLVSLGAAGCGGSSSSSGGHVSFAKTKFVLHAGLAFGAFHHFIYKPFRAGRFSSRAPGRTGSFVKAGAAALFVAHELKIARKDAQASPALRKLFSPLTALSSRFSGIGPKLKGGSANPGELNGLNGAVEGLRSQSSGAGAKVRDIVPKTPSG